MADLKGTEIEGKEPPRCLTIMKAGPKKGQPCKGKLRENSTRCHIHSVHGMMQGYVRQSTKDPRF